MRWGRAYFAVQALAGAVWWVAVFASPTVRQLTLGQLDPVVVALVDVPLFVGASAAAAFGVRSAAYVSTGWTGFVTLALAVYATVTTEAGWGVLVMGAATAGSVVALSLMVFGRVPTAWIARGPFSFRPASIRPTVSAHVVSAHVVSTFGQIVVFWGLFLAVIPAAITIVEQRWGVSLPFAPAVAPLGVVLLVLASALGLSSAAVMSTLGAGTPLPSAMPNKLVIAGPYRWIRNPMAASGIVQGLAVGLIASSWLVVVYAIAGSLLWNYAVRPLEEADLEQRFGDQFRQYRDNVRCWLPRLRPLSDPV